MDMLAEGACLVVGTFMTVFTVGGVLLVRCPKAAAAGEAAVAGSGASSSTAESHAASAAAPVAAPTAAEVAAWCAANQVR